MRHPAQDVGLTTQLHKTVHLGICEAKKSQEMVRGTAVVANRLRTECNAEGINGTIEDGRQRMLKRRPAGPVHEEIFGTGRACCATSRGYSNKTSCGGTCT